MISANEAKHQTEQSVDNIVKNELSFLEERIKDSIVNGEFYIVIEQSLRKETVAKLKELGYKISVDSQYAYYDISWGDNNKTH